MKSTSWCLQLSNGISHAMFYGNFQISFSPFVFVVYIKTTASPGMGKLEHQSFLIPPMTTSVDTVASSLLHMFLPTLEHQIMYKSKFY